MSSTVFKDYSKYYNLLYKDKDYQKEVGYIDSLIQKYADGQVNSIIDFGCGTGKHDYYLAEKGYHITGVDLSDDMLVIANSSEIRNTDFIQGDIRKVRLGKIYDVALSLFHVISYQQTWQDLFDSFTTAKLHLKSGGIFIFDFWYGPGVISDKPTERKKLVEDEELKIIRYTKPVMFPNDNVVDVNFEVHITDKKTNQEYQLSEIHRMRYLFLPELRNLLSTVGFSVIGEEEWITGAVPAFSSWNACIIAKI
ncbi:MAG: class I SAM-dependent methyltransferase [Ferruginibacter sp.]